jgi:hypothetical protein
MLRFCTKTGLILGAWVVAAAAPALAQINLAEPPPTDEKPSRVSRLQGTVAIDRYNEVLGATVVVHPEGDESTLYLTSTGRDGVFRIDGLPDGEYQLDINRPGFSPLSKNAVTMRYPFRAVVEVKMTPVDPATTMLAAYPGDDTGAVDAISVSGKVVTRRAGPIDEVDLRFIRPGGGRDPRAWRTDVDGNFRIEVESGVWRLEVVGVGYLPVWTWIDFREDSELSIQLVPQPPDYAPTLFELLPAEVPVPPVGWEQRGLRSGLE